MFTPPQPAREPEPVAVPEPTPPPPAEPEPVPAAEPQASSDGRGVSKSDHGGRFLIIMGHITISLTA